MRIIIVLGTLVIINCVSTMQAVNSAKSKYVGRNIDEFVINNGAPYQKYTMNNGNLLFRWSSGVERYHAPATKYTNGSINGNSYNSTTNTVGGYDLDMYCELQIITDQNGTILDIIPLRDSGGFVNISSRCYEILR